MPPSQLVRPVARFSRPDRDVRRSFQNSIVSGAPAPGRRSRKFRVAGLTLAVHRAEKFDQPPDEPLGSEQANCPPRFQSPTRSTREWHSSFQFKLHQIVERNPSYNLHAFGADFIQRIPRGMPWRKIEIDQIDHWNPDLVKGRMIVRDVTPKVGKMRSLPQSIGRSKDVTCQIDGRVW